MSQTWQKYMVPAGALLAAAGFLFGVYLPQSRRLRAIRAETEQVRAELADRAARLEARATVGGSEATALAAVPFDEAIPTGPHLGEFLESLDEMARAAGLRDRNIVPGAAVDGERVSWLPLDMNFHGDFAAVYGFLQKVEAQRRVARVQRLELTTNAVSGNALSSSLTLHVYFRRS